MADLDDGGLLVGSSSLLLSGQLLAGSVLLLCFPLHGDVGDWLHLGGLGGTKPGRFTRRRILLRFFLEVLRRKYLAS